MKRSAKYVFVPLMVLLIGTLATQTVFSREDDSRSFVEWLYGVIEYFVDLHDQDPAAHGGPSHGEVYFTQVRGPIEPAGFEVVAKLEVPPGSYVVTGKAEVRFNSPVAAGWSGVCGILMDGESVDSAQVGMSINSGIVATIPLAGAGSFSEEGLIEMECVTSESELLFIKLIATQVESLTEQ